MPSLVIEGTILVRFGFGVGLFTFFSVLVAGSSYSNAGCFTCSQDLCLDIVGNVQRSFYFTNYRHG